MASTGVNMLRWGALVAGVFYGISHQSAITSRDRASHFQHEWDSKQKLIDQAKQAYLQKTQGHKMGGVISNPDDPKFDLEAYLKDVESKSK
ncbi:hypothetical protein LTR62_005428 [Meristemomyces frigidus]|uniref:ATP synthase F(0) complex subunit e, mitochondrial n=1 Tax=Meristemomyces frigidus TaxID=1508187 RepID=A0AAN7TD21_9PEZI|nr:hypothetical protein LTR62_005428 [Meristemomyces frigidus]